MLGALMPADPEAGREHGVLEGLGRRRAHGTGLGPEPFSPAEDP
jgi:hypothetical protein